MSLCAGVDDASVDYCTQLIGQYEATDQGKFEGLMSIDGKEEPQFAEDGVQMILATLCSI